MSREASSSVIEALEELERATTSVAPDERAAYVARAARLELARGRPRDAEARIGRARTELGLPSQGTERLDLAIAETRVWEGRAADARALVDQVIDAGGAASVAARALGLVELGALAASELRFEDAEAQYARALDSLAGPVWAEAAARAALGVARVRLDRGLAEDAAGASTVLSVARDRIEQAEVTELLPELALLTARARAAIGDPDGGAEGLSRCVAEARRSGRLDLVWQAEAAWAEVERARGADFAARRHDVEAVEVLEGLAMGLPPDARDAFWSDGRRALVRRRAAATSGRSEAVPGADRRLAPASERLLEILKRLAGEHERDRLLERITDSAVELSGAERGIVLLRTEQGELEPYLHRHADIQRGDPSVAFSRSIAESVLIDGEPLLTLDAQGDGRLTEYLSVHRLMLRSVACVPIRAAGEVLGVLYLEHRLRAGRFGDGDLSLLMAFADQAAIALRNARLLERLDERGRELERANQELREARDELASRLVDETERLERTQWDLEEARRRLADASDRYGIVGRSPAMKRVFAVLDRVAERDVPVVVQGESGTGKELAAQAIHRGSGRASGPFVAVNCAAIPETLLESELFGHVKGAFTGAERDRRGLFERASTGTLFLDEVGDMPVKMQVGLLRALAERKVARVGASEPVPVDVRVVCATQRPLSELVAEGRFREDLYYRLEVVAIRLPPLRERREDIPLLADHFLARFAERDDGRRRRMSRAAIERLMAHPLPGNVRQLEHLIVNACVMGTGDLVLADDLALDGGLPPAVAAAVEAAAASPTVDPPTSAAPATHEDFKSEERRRILEALDQHGWNRARAARALGIPRRTFYRRLKQHGIL